MQNNSQGAGIKLDTLISQCLGEVAADGINGHVLQLKLQAARKNSYRQLIGFCSGQQKLHVGGRLFENLQQRIKSRLAQHVHFVDEIHLKAPRVGHVLSAVLQVVYVFDFVLRRPVHLDKIYESSFTDRRACIATATGRGTHPLLTIQAARKHSRNGGFANAAGAGEQIGVMQPVVIQRMQSNAHPQAHRRQPGAPGRRWTKGFTLIGHRGAAGLVAENTLPSFQRATAEGCQAIELDVYAVDGELLVIHDDTLNRTTNGKGRVISKSAKALRALDAGQKTAPGARIPFLSEVFAVLPKKVAVNIELKGPATAKPVAKALSDWQPANEVLVSSFDHDLLRTFRSEDAATPVAPLFHRTNREMLAIACELNACAVNLNARIATKARLSTIRAAGFGAAVYTVNSLAVARRLFRDGATGVFTDRPDRVTFEQVTALE